MGVGGVCFNCKIIERIRETSLEVRDDLGLNSHNLAMRSHSVPGSTSSASATNCFSAFLFVNRVQIKTMQRYVSTNILY